MTCLPAGDMGRSIGKIKEPWNLSSGNLGNVNEYYILPFRTSSTYRLLAYLISSADFTKS